MNLIEMLVKHEGLRLKPYRCTAGKLTIGVGRNLESVGITKEEAEILLRHDIERCRKFAEEYSWFSKLDSVRQDVVLSMIFNLGPAGFKAFKGTISCIESGNYEQAAKQMLESRWARQVGNRSTELANLMRYGDYSKI